MPVRNAEFNLDGKKYAFSWRDAAGGLIPLNRPSGSEVGDIGREIIFVEPDQVAVSGDLSFYRGHFYPAKAPGGAFIAVPAYFLIHGVEWIAGADPDNWWTLTLNAWLTSVLSVGLVSALGCVLFYGLALRLSGGRAMESLLATLTFAFGTMFFPYGTALFEHNIIAIALLTSFYLLYRVKENDTSSHDRLSDGKVHLLIYLAGLCAGYSAITNYITVVEYEMNYYEEMQNFYLALSRLEEMTAMPLIQ